MMKCWQKDAGGRPKFTELRNELKEMENQHKVCSWLIDRLLIVKINVGHK